VDVPVPLPVGIEWSSQTTASLVVPAELLKTAMSQGLRIESLVIRSAGSAIPSESTAIAHIGHTVPIGSIFPSRNDGHAPISASLGRAVGWPVPTSVMQGVGSGVLEQIE